MLRFYVVIGCRGLGAPGICFSEDFREKGWIEIARSDLLGQPRPIAQVVRELTQYKPLDSSGGKSFDNALVV